VSNCEPDLRSPYPWFGGKSSVASLVWERFGDVRNFVDPFMGSLAMLLGRPTPFDGTETVNDADGFVCNFWRAVQSDAEAVATFADWPVNENDLHARHAWLVGKREDITRRLEGDPDWFDAKVAGWWVWGACCWIGSGWCSGKGPWGVVEVDGARQLIHLGNAGQGVNRKRIHLGNAGRGVNRKRAELASYFAGLADRLRDVRVCCGDWSRVCGPTPTIKMGLTAVFLDPPYADTAKRTADLYSKDSLSVAHEVREWAIKWGDHPDMRIALCGYEGEHAMPGSWECVAWKAKGGYGSQGDGDNANAARERIWFSPNCLKPESERMPLFAGLGESA